MPRDRTKLTVFRRAHELALEVYRLTAHLPSSGALRLAGATAPGGGVGAGEHRRRLRASEVPGVTAEQGMQ